MGQNTATWGNGYAMTPGWLLLRRPSPNALTLYVHLAMHGRFDHGTGTYEECRPSIKRLSQGDPKSGYPGTGMSPATIHRALRELIKLGAIEGTQVYSASGGQLPTVYRVHFGRVAPPEAAESSGGGVTSDRGGCHPRQGGGVTSDRGGVSPVTEHLEPITQNQLPRPASPTPPRQAASSAAGAAEAGRQGADDFETQKVQSGQADHAAHAQAAEIISAIDWPARCRVDQGTQLRLVALASRCLAAGHSVGAVQAAVTEDLPAVWGAGLLVRRLQDLAENQRTDAEASSARVETPHQFEAGKSPGYCRVCGRRQENRLHRSLPQLPSEEQLAAEWLTLSGRNPAEEIDQRATETAQAGDRCEHGRRVCVTCHGGRPDDTTGSGDRGRPAPRQRPAADPDPAPGGPTPAGQEFHRALAAMAGRMVTA